MDMNLLSLKAKVEKQLNNAINKYFSTGKEQTVKVLVDSQLYIDKINRLNIWHQEQQDNVEIIYNIEEDSKGNKYIKLKLKILPGSAPECITSDDNDNPDDDIEIEDNLKW